VTRAVLDPGVLVSALITPSGTPAKLLTAAGAGAFVLIVSPLLMEELEPDTVVAYLAFLQREAVSANDPGAPPPIRCEDPDDDYLIALAHSRTAALVSGDRHLLDLAGRIPVYSPVEFLAPDQG
jgi:predicted nucleic acid-binding protein